MMSGGPGRGVGVGAAAGAAAALVFDGVGLEGADGPPQEARRNAVKVLAGKAVPRVWMFMGA